MHKRAVSKVRHFCTFKRMEAICMISRASFIVIIQGEIDEINSATVIFINAGGKE